MAVREESYQALEKKKKQLIYVRQRKEEEVLSKVAPLDSIWRRLFLSFADSNDAHNQEDNYTIIKVYN